MNTNLDKLFDKVDEKTASAFADVLLPVRPDAEEKQKVESRVLSAAGGKKRRALRPWHAVIAACLVVAVTLGAVFAPSIFGNGRQRVLEGGNFYNPDGKTVTVDNADNLKRPYPNLSEIEKNCFDESNGKAREGYYAFKGKVAGGSINICTYPGESFAQQLVPNKSFMITPIEVTEVINQHNDNEIRVGDVIYVQEVFVYVTEDLIEQSGVSCKAGDYLKMNSSTCYFLLEPEHEYLIIGLMFGVDRFEESNKTLDYHCDLSTIKGKINGFIAYDFYVFDVDNRPAVDKITTDYISCYDEVIAKYCG